MSTITRRINVGSNRHINIEIDLPAEVPAGEIEAVIDLKPVVPQAKNRISAVYGKGGNKSRMSDDFDEPLDDFAEYQ